MEMEYQRPRAQEYVPQIPMDAAQRAAFREFVAGLQAMSTNLEALLFNFAWAAGQIAGDPDAPAKLVGMMEFAVAYHRFGLRTAMDAIGNNSGVLVDVMSGQDGRGVSYRPGILVGLVGIEHSFATGRADFDGIALIEDSRMREKFIAVTVSTNGATQVHREQYDFHKPDLISDKPVEEIFPPENT